MQSSGWSLVTTYLAPALGFEVMAGAVAGIASHQAKAKKKEKKKRSADDAGLAGDRTTVAKLAAVDEMRVPELRSELSKRTLDTAGLKAQLVERLKTAIKGPSSSGDGKKKAAASSP